MEIKVETSQSNGSGDPKTPLLEASDPRTPHLQPSDSTKRKEGSSAYATQAMSQTFKSFAYLGSRLPTGALLAFQLLSPIFSNQGKCDIVYRSLMGILLSLCGLACVLLSFSDSIKDTKGNNYYGFATFKGFWIIDRTVTISPEEAAKLKIYPSDFVQAIMSLWVFAAIALLDPNVVHCFYPTPSTGLQELLSVLPIGIGVISSLVFVAFPTQRHGIGCQVNTNDQ